MRFDGFQDETRNSDGHQPVTINGLQRKIRSSINGRDCEEKESKKDS